MSINFNPEEMAAKASARGKQNGTDAAPDELGSVCAADIEMAEITWVWPGRLAFGKVGLLAGLPDEGKGQVFAYIAARITRGSEWPCGEGRAPKGSVILLTAEDDLSDTVVPRLAAAGADLTKVHFIKMVRTNSGKSERMFSLVDDLELLRKKVTAIGDVVMVQIDPMSAYLGVGKVNSFRTTDVRAVLAPLVQLAAELKIAVLGILHFNKKLDVTNALLRISDSLAFGATARHVYAIIDDAEHGRKLMVKGKNNLAPGKQKALAYTFSEKVVDSDPVSGRPITAPYVAWRSEYVDVTASEAMAATNENKSPGARNEAKQFLLEYLADGPMPGKAIDDAAEAHGISKRTLMRARAELDIRITKRGFGKDGEWIWELRPKPDPDTGF
jgi:putative DNA primase/helicase